MSRSWALLWRGMRWRLMGSVLIVLTSAIAMGTAIIGPLYLQAGGDSLVKRAVAGSPVQETGVTLTAGNGHDVSLTQITTESHALLEHASLRDRFGPPLRSVTSFPYATSPGGTEYDVPLAFRTGVCAVLHFSSGRCTLGLGDAVISARSARLLDLGTGSTITLTDKAGGAPVRLHITGVYQLPDENAPYWFANGASYFAFGTLSGPRNTPPLYVDDLFASSATALAVPANYVPTATVQVPLRPGAVSGSNAEATAAGVQAAERSAQDSGYQLSTELLGVLANAEHQRRLMDTIVAVAAVQLVLLAIWVLAAVLLRSADLRRSELRVARLRGFPLASMLAVTVAEPAILCAIGGVLGVIGAWAGVEIATSILFTQGTAVSLSAWVFIGFAAAALTICAVLGLSALRLLRGSGLDSGTPTGAKAGRARAVADAAILTVSVVALLAAATSGALASHSDPVAAAAPAVVALGVSVIAIRVVEYLCRRASRATVDRPAVASFLAVRQIGRRPAALRESRTLVIALCLACFAVCAWSVARTNRATAATFAVGAKAVVTVAPLSSVALQQAVDRADPQGHFAMAAVQISDASENLLAVDSSRLPAVISWPTGISRTSVTDLSRALRPATAPPVNLVGNRVSLSAGVGGTGAAVRDLSQLNLSLWVFNPAAGTSIIDLGRLTRGVHTYRGALKTFCAGDCRLEGIGVLPSGETAPAGSVQLVMSGLTQTGGSARGGSPRGGSPRAGTPNDLTAADWRANVTGVTVGAATNAVRFTFPASALAADIGAADAYTPAMASVADYPAHIPAVAGTNEAYTASVSGQEDTVAGEGLDGNPITVHPAVEASSLPRIGPDGEMLDLTMLERAQTEPVFASAKDEVWLGPDAPANALDRLRSAGLRIEGVQRASRAISQDQHTGPALAYDFMLLATIVALLVSAVGTFSVLAAGTRQRATELIALEVSGVPRPALRHSLALEAAILAFTALFGAGAGVIGAAIAIPSLPQLGSSTTAPLAYALPVWLILAVALAAVLVVFAATAVAARGILSRMSPSLLRAGSYDAD